MELAYYFSSTIKDLESLTEIELKLNNRELGIVFQ